MGKGGAGGKGALSSVNLILFHINFCAGLGTQRKCLARTANLNQSETRAGTFRGLLQRTDDDDDGFGWIW